MYSNNLIYHSMKMKFFKSLLIIVCLLSNMSVLAQENCFVVDGIFYKAGFVDVKTKMPIDTICMVVKGDEPYKKEDITIPETVVYNNKKITVIGIDSDSFMKCDNLKKITIPNTVTAIGLGAFRYCNGLTDVTIPNSVTVIDRRVFEYSTGLTCVTIGSSVKNIGGQVFRGCTGLTTLYSRNPIPPKVSENSFDNEHYETLKVFVPRSALAKYKQAEGWKNFKKLQAFDPK